MILRILIKNRRSTLINFLGLVLGLTSFITIFSWVRTEYSVDRFHSHKGRLFQLVIQFPEGILDANTPYALAPAMMNSFPEVEAITRLVRLETQMNSSFDFFPEDPDNEPVYETKVARVDTGFFNMFSFEYIHGSEEYGLQRPDGILLSREIAEKYFGESNPVGAQIMMNGSELLEITGVIDIPENSQLYYDLFLLTPEGLQHSWTWRDPSFIMLYEGVETKSFEEKIVTFLEETIPNPLPGDFLLKIVPIEKANLVFGKRKEFMIFSGIAILILLIVAINYMNLSTANYTKRIREMGIRKIIGATPRVLGNQLLYETLILTFLAMILALFLTELLLPKLNTLFNSNVRIGYGENPLILPGLILLVVLFSLLSVAYPILVLTRGNPTAILRDTFVKGRKRSTMLLVTTIFQFTVSLCLLISTMVVLKQVQYAKNTPPGLHVDSVVKIPLNPQIGARLFQFFDELESNPGVLATTAGQKNPINEDYKTNIDWSGRDPATFPLVRYTICLPDFPTFFGHEILFGRLFNDSLFTDINSFLVNEAACEMLERDNPVGDKITMWGLEGEILGVFRNFHHTSVRSEILPHVINIHPDNYRHLRYMFVRIRPEQEAETLTYIKDTFNQFAGDFPFTYEFLNEEVDRMYAKDIRLAKILGVFSFLALLISCLGIYGLARFSAEKRTRDLTIRRVFGASYSSLVQLANAEMLRRIGLAVILAIPVSYLFMERWLREFAYRTGLSWWFFLLGGIIGIGITVTATMIGIWRSLKQKPTEVLKQA